MSELEELINTLDIHITILSETVNGFLTRQEIISIAALREVFIINLVLY
jgi:hypothetical protein